MIFLHGKEVFHAAFFYARLSGDLVSGQSCLEKFASVSSRSILENVLKSFFASQNKIFPREILPKQGRKINERRSG
jgi:hypothetical protein